MHRILLKSDQDPLLDLHHPLIITGEEARHTVRVRRARLGEPVELLDAAGGRGHGRIESIVLHRRGDPELLIALERLTHEPPPRPRIEVCAAAPKGDRLETMIEQLGQVGASAWRPLLADRSVVDPSLRRLDRLRRIALESIKQSGRAWPLEVLEPVDSAQALAPPAPGEVVLLADPRGPHGPSILAHAAAAPSARILIGPEGGWSDGELAHAAASQIHALSLGPAVMRIGTAAVAAAAVLMALAAPRGSITP